MSEIRKQKIINRRSLPGLLHCAAQPAGRPSQQPAQPTSLLCHLRPDRGRGVWPARAHGHRATPPLSLPACPPLLASMPWTTPRLPPALSHSPPALPSSPSLSLSPGRTPPSPPFAIAAISGHPSLPRLAQELRLDSLFLPTAPQLPGSPASPPRRRSPLRAPTVAAVEFTVTSASPSPLTIPADSR